MGTDINETGRQGQRMKQGEQGQMEGCQRCDGNGNRMDCNNYRVEIGTVGIKNLECLAKKTFQ